MIKPYPSITTNDLCFFVKTTQRQIQCEDYKTYFKMKGSMINLLTMGLS